jgi:C-terminal processing protease CtpA/Prc
MKGKISNCLLFVVCFFWLFLVFSLEMSFGQEKPAESKSSSLSAEMKTDVVEGINKLMVEKYIFLETAKKMEELLETKLEKGEYDEIDNIQEFARILTKDLRSVSKDLHIRVVHDPELVQSIKDYESQSEQDRLKARRARLERERKRNFGYQKLEILDGNIGYLDLRYFTGVRESGPTAAAAMNFLANTEAVIIDLRQNGGGDPATIQFISSYFLDEYTHLNSFENRGEDSLQQFWTLPYVPGKSMYETDLYILTSRRTFSAAEEFTYNMKNLKRATLVGETTGGGAHPGGYQIVSHDFLVWVPTGRAVNPITQTNWEGKGIKPHIEVPKDQALKTAHRTALERLAEKAEDSDKKREIEWMLESLKAKDSPAQVDETILRKYVGNYTRGNVILEKGELWIEAGPQKMRMIPLTETYFILEGEPEIRVEFTREKTGQSYEIIVHFQDGSKEIVKRVKSKQHSNQNTTICSQR